MDTQFFLLVLVMEC